MWLRLFTTVMFALTLALMVCRPLIVGPMPHKPVKRAEALVYSERALTFTSLLIVFIIGTGYGAIRLVRIAKDEYRRQAADNMKAMIDGALKDQADHANKQHGTSD